MFNHQKEGIVKNLAFSFWIFFSLLLPSISFSQIEQTDSKNVQRLKTLIPELIEKALIPGLSIALIEDGRIRWLGSFGVMNASSGQPVTDNTLFESASLSKPVFTYGVMKLVQDHKLDLDKPLVEYISSEYLHRVYPPAKTQNRRLKQITARMVLTHSTGFPNWFQGRPLSIAYTPGRKFSYSGEAFTLLAKIVEKICGQSLVDFTKTQILDPLGMKNSSFIWYKQFEPRFSRGHNAMGNVTIRGRAHSVLVGASLYTTARDYATFLTALINGTGLKKKVLKQMFKEQIIAFQNDKEKFYWGLGVGINHNKLGKSIWHWGDNGHFKAYFEVVLKKKLGVVYFANSINGLAIAKELLTEGIGLKNPAIATNYFSYPHYSSPAIQMNRFYKQKGINGVLDYLKSTANNPRTLQLLTAAKIEEFAQNIFLNHDLKGALTVLSFSKSLFPDSDSHYRLLGVFSILNGNGKQGLDYLKKSMYLNSEQEMELNKMGYNLLGIKELKAALVIFHFNAAQYPNSANCYDSLAEAYMRMGNKTKALTNFKKTLETIPKDHKTSKMLLKQLESRAKKYIKELSKD